MVEVDLKTWILENLITSHGFLNASRVKDSWFQKTGNNHYLSLILNVTSFLDEFNVGLSERIYCIVNNITERPTCLLCSGDVSFKQYSFGYRVYCSRECSNDHAEVRIQKTMETNLQRYGVSNYRKLPECSKKIRETNLERYGVEHTLQLEHVTEARENASIQKFGTSNPFESNELQREIRRKHLDREGVEHQAQKKLGKKVVSLLNNKNWLLNQHHTLEKSQTQIGREIGVNQTTIHRYLNKHNIEIFYYDDSSSSDGEREVDTFIKSFYSEDYVRKDRAILSDRRELDFYFPQANFAIEYCGIYWHSTFKSDDPRKHLRKTLECREKGINLLHIFCYEWNDPVKRAVIESMIKMKLGHCGSKTYARNCYVEAIGKRECVEFLKSNHLQSIDSMKTGGVRLGLRDKKSNELLSVMTFGAPRFSKKNNHIDYELIRYCTLRNNQVIGGASKLLKHFERKYQPKGVVTYANLRYSYGEVYGQLGFKVTSSTIKPSYAYTKDFITVESKRKFRRNNLYSLFGDNFDPGLSEVQNCLKNGWYQVFDCGTETYIKSY